MISANADLTLGQAELSTGLHDFLFKRVTYTQIHFEI
jgi:hypothetical protein